MITFPPQMRNNDTIQSAYRKLGQQCMFRMNMARGNLNMMKQKFVFDNGVEILCSHRFGKEDVWVYVPEEIIETVPEELCGIINPFTKEFDCDNRHWTLDYFGETPVKSYTDPFEGVDGGVVVDYDFEINEQPFTVMGLGSFSEFQVVLAAKPYFWCVYPAELTRKIWDFVAEMRVSDGSTAGVSLQKWGFAGSEAAVETLEPRGGTNWWTDGERTLSWEMGGISRYSEGSNYGGFGLFMEDVLLATSPVAIAGAAMRGDEIIVIGESGDTYKFCDRQWTKIGVFPVGYRLNCAVSFNHDCSLAVSVIIQTHISPDNTYLVTFSVFTDSVSVEIEDLFVKNENYWSKPIAADFKGLELVTAVLEYTRTDTGGEIVNPNELVWESASDYIVSYSGSSFTKQLERLTLTIGAHTTILSAYEVTRTQTNAGWRGTLLDMTPNLSSDTTYCYQDYYSYISGLDLRVGLLAVYKRGFGSGVVSSKSSSRQLTHDNNGNVTVGEWVYTSQGHYQIEHERTKSITDLAKNETTVVESRSDSLTGSNFTYPPEAGFDLDVWSGPTESNPDGGIFLFGLPTYDYEYMPFENIDGTFISRQKNAAVFVSWRTSYIGSHMYYTGGVVGELLNTSENLFAASVKII